MYKLTSKLIVYREIGEDSILMKLADRADSGPDPQAAGPGDPLRV